MASSAQPARSLSGACIPHGSAQDCSIGTGTGKRGFRGGAAFTFALFFDANTFSVGAAFGAALIHELTTIWDVAYTAPRRDIKPHQHHTHSFLEVLPFIVGA